MQIEGTFLGREFYFRARGRRWSIGVGGDPVSAPQWSRGAEWGRGPYAAGWMPHKTAWRLVRKSLRAWALENGYRVGPRRRGGSKGWRRHVRRAKAARTWRRPVRLADVAHLYSVPAPRGWIEEMFCREPALDQVVFTRGTSMGKTTLTPEFAPRFVLEPLPPDPAAVASAELLQRLQADLERRIFEAFALPNGAMGPVTAADLVQVVAEEAAKYDRVLIDQITVERDPDQPNAVRVTWPPQLAELLGMLPPFPDQESKP